MKMRIDITSTQVKNIEYVVYTWLDVSHIEYDGAMLYVFLNTSTHVPSYSRKEFISFKITTKN